MLLPGRCYMPCLECGRCLLPRGRWLSSCFSGRCYCQWNVADVLPLQCIATIDWLMLLPSGRWNSHMLLICFQCCMGRCYPDYGLVIDRLHLYCDMQLVTFGIDKDKNLIIQFPVFIQPYTQQPLIPYQIETVPVQS